MKRTAYLLLVLNAVLSPCLKADELVDLREGFGKAKWGMSPEDLKKQVPGLEDVTEHAMAKEQEYRNQQIVLTQPGKSPVIETRYFFLRGELERVERFFDKSVTKVSPDVWKIVLEKQFVPPQPKPPGSVVQAPGGFPPGIEPMRRRLQNNSWSVDSFPGLSVAGEREQIYASLYAITSSDPVRWNALAPNPEHPWMQLTMENYGLKSKLLHELDDEMLKTETDVATELAPLLTKP